MYNFFDVVSDYATSSRNDKYKEYVTKRNWTQETQDKWALGYFPPNTVLGLKVKIINNGGHESDLDHHGVCKNGRSLFYDRLIFPIYDTWGKKVAITGRVFGDQKPKYFNTVYEKTKILYGLNYAIESILKTGRVYVFEGNADVITAHQFGIENAVCIMGTTFSEDHYILLSRYAKEIVLVFDNDAGGQKALASFNKKQIERPETKVFRCMFNKYKDADEFLNKEGKDEVLTYLESSISNAREQHKLKNIK